MPPFSWDGTAEDESGAIGGHRETRNSKEFEVWRDTASEEEAASPAPQVMEVSASDHSQYRTKQHSDSTQAAPQFTSVPTSRTVTSSSNTPYSGHPPSSDFDSDVDDLKYTHHMQSLHPIRQEPSYHSAPHTCFDGPMATLHSPPPGTRINPKVTYPISAESNFPITAQHLAGNRDIEPSVANHIPWTDQIICSCKKPARTFESRIVQCNNPECAVGWYHYTCLDRSAKISSLWGNLHCQACRQMDEWSLRAGGKMTRIEDFKIPFAREDILAALMVGGETDPYGLAGEM